MRTNRYASLVGLVFIVSVIIEVFSLTSSKVPEHLHKCYNSSRENVHRAPFTQHIFIELLRKLEHNRTEPNIRLLSNAILHTVKFDGIQHADSYERSAANERFIGLPYRASSQEFFKYRLIVDHLTPDSSAFQQFPHGALSDEEFCLLHNMISNVLDTRQRNDERVTCSMSFRRLNLVEFDARDDLDMAKTECPEQKGVMRTEWGTVTPGTLIAGIASALQRDNVPLNQLLDDSGIKINSTMNPPLNPSQNVSTTTQQPINRGSNSDNIVDNIWMATLGGVLGQVVINQASDRPRILSEGKWNDTLLPRKLFLNGDHWDINNAEFLGAIDGLILASKIRKWSETYPAASLSQVIDMYYSHRGVAYDRSIRACERGRNFAELVKNFDFVNGTITATEALSAFGGYQNSIDMRRVDHLARAVVDQLMIAADTLITQFDNCDAIKEDSQHQQGINELILIIDHTYSPYDTERILSTFIDQMDISHYTSTIGLLSGSSGKWLLPVTNDVVNVFANYSMANWPVGLSLSSCLHTIINYYQNMTSCDADGRMQQVPKSRAIVILAQSSQLTDNDLAEAQRSIDSILNFAPETRFIYVLSKSSSSSASLMELSRQSGADSSITLFADENKNIATTIITIANELRRLPAGIINVYCDGAKSLFEDYIQPKTNNQVDDQLQDNLDDGRLYEIHSGYMAAIRDVSVTFRAKGDADLSICLMMDERMCKELTVNDEVTFNVAKDNNQCSSSSSSSSCSIRFSVVANRTALKCSAFDCRYPDQIRVEIETQWTNRAGSISPTQTTLQLCMFALISLLSYQIC